jgi:hypothetical protein
MPLEAVLKVTDQRLIEFSVGWRVGRDMLDVGNLTMVTYLGREIIKEGFSIHCTSSQNW